MPQVQQEQFVRLSLAKILVASAALIAPRLAIHIQQDRGERNSAPQLTGRALKRELANAGFTRTFRTCYRGWIAVFIISLIVAAVLALASTFPQSFAAPGLTQAAVTGVIGLGALYLGFQQWSATRSALALDKFYERLAATNQKLDEYPGAREFAGPWRDTHEEDENLAFERKMYVYLELDNLECAIAKYNISYISPSYAYRSLRTFRQRCVASSEFRKLASNCVENLGYNAQTKQAVESSMRYANHALEGRQESIINQKLPRGAGYLERSITHHRTKARDDDCQRDDECTDG